MASSDNSGQVDPAEVSPMCPPTAYTSILMALRAAVELKVFDIMAEQGRLGTQLSTSQIVSKISTVNPNSTSTLRRILRWLSFNSLLTTSLLTGSTSEDDRLFGLTPLTASMTSGTQAAGLVILNTETEMLESFRKLKDAVLDPEGHKSAFELAHGVGFYEYLARRPGSWMDTFFRQTFGSDAKMYFENVFRVYRGFDEVDELLDVGGSDGSALEHLISVCPNIRGINFDLPEVIAQAPVLKGVEHVAGDMFESIPNSKTIMLKYILHNWPDDKCIKLLKNCRRALPEEGGKVIVLEHAFPQVIENNKETVNALLFDFFMLTIFNGKERTVSELSDLAMMAGFSGVKAVSVGHGVHVLEFLK